MNAYKNFSLRRSGWCRTALLSIASLLLVTACDPAGSYWKSRKCNGFDHSGINDWAMGQPGVPLRFRSDAGDVIEFKLISEEGQGPTTQSDRFGPDYHGNSDDVSCTMTYERIYQADNADTKLEFRYIQYEDYKDQPDADQSFRLGIRVFHPIEHPKAVPGSLRFELHPDGWSLQDNHPVFFVGDTQYNDVIVDTHWQLHRLPPYGPPTDWPDEALIQVATFAKGAGLLQLEYLNGDIYTREDALNGF